MKKKILLSVFSVFSLMIASKSFAQSYHPTYIRTEASYNYRVQKAMKDVKIAQDILNLDLVRLDRVHARMNKDIAYRDYVHYRRTKESEQTLLSLIAQDRNKLAIAKRDLEIAKRLTYGRF